MFRCVTDSHDFVSVSLTDASHRRRSVSLKHSPFHSARLLVTVAVTLHSLQVQLRSLAKVVLKRFEGQGPHKICLRSVNTTRISTQGAPDYKRQSNF